MRERYSIETTKCIYPLLPYPANSGLLERAFIEMASHDSSVTAFCKIIEQKHDFVSFRYLRDDGTMASYYPDFLVKIDNVIYFVETKAQWQVSSLEFERKSRAAVAWCDRINEIELKYRMNCEWNYAIIGEHRFYEWRDKDASMRQMLEFSCRRKEYIYSTNLFS